MWSVRMIVLQHSSNLHRKLWVKHEKIAGRQERENHLFCTCDVVTGLDKLKFAAILRVMQSDCQRVEVVQNHKYIREKKSDNIITTSTKLRKNVCVCV